jgi:UDP-N-acetylglucosamine--N-acetylmuramyl-(pentapeptide) pyrophosphoryl-undecaprenol N-acetylglucosamine transferase
MAGPVAFLCAGGTGGHLFPAEALAAELSARGWEPHLLTDTRAERFVSAFPPERIHRIPAATISGKNPFKLAAALYAMHRGVLASRGLIRKFRPSIVIGFGGYPSLPPLVAGLTFRLPTMIHEQNAVPGRANRFLAPRVTAIAGGFLDDTIGPHAAKTVTTGNPVRPPVIAAAATPFVPPIDGGAFRLLVFGGSQGAQFFSTAVPAALALLAEGERKRLVVTQQAREADMAAAREAYARCGIEAELAPFFSDMPKRIAGAHLVICRSGASTVSEIAVIGRPALFVPYPHALDHDQAANAAKLARTGGVEVARQDTLTPAILAARIKAAMDDPAALAAKAAAARTAGRPDAAALLAALAEAIASGQSAAAFKAAQKH